MGTVRVPRECRPAARRSDCEARGGTCQLANAMRSLGARKGVRVCVDLPMVPEAAVAMAG